MDGFAWWNDSRRTRMVADWAGIFLSPHPVRLSLPVTHGEPFF